MEVAFDRLNQLEDARDELAKADLVGTRIRSSEIVGLVSCIEFVLVVSRF